MSDDKNLSLEEKAKRQFLNLEETRYIIYYKQLHQMCPLTDTEFEEYILLTKHEYRKAEEQLQRDAKSQYKARHGQYLEKVPPPLPKNVVAEMYEKDQIIRHQYEEQLNACPPPRISNEEKERLKNQ